MSHLYNMKRHIFNAHLKEPEHKVQNKKQKEAEEEEKEPSENEFDFMNDSKYHTCDEGDYIRSYYLNPT